MKKLQWGIVVVLGLYALYAVKSELGINFSDRYHAIDLFRVPLRAVHRIIDT